MANWYIFTPAAAAQLARSELTEKGRAYGFLGETARYIRAVAHPVEDKAALLVDRSEPMAYQGVVRSGYDFEPIFDEIETKGEPVEELTEDWGL